MIYVYIIVAAVCYIASVFCFVTNNTFGLVLNLGGLMLNVWMISDEYHKGGIYD